MTRTSSKPNCSWRNTEVFSGRDTLPVSGSRSPARIFMNVDLPAPLGPVSP